MKATEITTIKKLIQVNLDAADGLYTAADNITDSVMQSFLSRCARIRKKYARVLYLSLSREEALSLSEKIESNIRNMWSQLKSATYKFYPSAILQECRQAEEYALSAYDEALSLNLPSSIRTQLSAQKKALNERYAELTKMATQLGEWTKGGYSSKRA